MIREALQYIVGLGEKEEMRVNGKTFIAGGGEVTRVEESYIKDPIKVGNLSSIVKYLRDDVDAFVEGGASIVITVESPTRVTVKTDANEDANRSFLMIAEPVIPDALNFGRFYDSEDFNIALQSRFTETDDKSKLLLLSGNVQDGAVKTINDDGISQSATIKTGVASVGEVIVPNPVLLAPYRTFTDVEQPISKFIFRMKSGPTCALFEADGGAWRNEAIQYIAHYLDAELTEQLEEDARLSITILS